MIRKIRNKLLKLLQLWVERLNSKENEREYQERLLAVKFFFHETLPSMDEKWAGKAIIEDGRFNYFVLPDGSLPKYDFAMPEIPLYVVVPDVSSADWEQARQRGIRRDSWEKSQQNLVSIEKITPTLST